MSWASTFRGRARVTNAAERRRSRLLEVQSAVRLFLDTFQGKQERTNRRSQAAPVVRVRSGQPIGDPNHRLQSPRLTPPRPLSRSIPAGDDLSKLPDFQPESACAIGRCHASVECPRASIPPAWRDRPRPPPPAAPYRSPARRDREVHCRDRSASSPSRAEPYRASSTPAPRDRPRPPTRAAPSRSPAPRASESARPRLFRVCAQSSGNLSRVLSSSAARSFRPRGIRCQLIGYVQGPGFMTARYTALASPAAATPACRTVIGTHGFQEPTDPNVGR
jgi:hypothetical protein